MKRKVALLISNLCTKGGVERVAATLSAEMAKRYDCHLIMQWDTGNHAYDLSKDVKTFSVYPEKRRQRYMFLEAARRIKRYVQEEGIEVIIAVGRVNGPVPLLVKLALGKSVKLIWSEHGAISSYLFEHESAAQKIYRNILQQMILHVPDKLTVLTGREKECYQQMYHKDPKEITVIPNFIEESLLAGVHPYDETAKRIITVGRIVYQKGYGYLVETAKRVLGSHPDWSWDIYGDGDAAYTAELSSLIEKSGLSGRLVMRGNSDCIYDLYSNYGLYVMTSHYEGLPMVLLEAKAKRLPLVSFDIYSGPSDVILDGVNGYLVKPFDVDAMAEKISFLMDHPEVRQDFSAHAYDNIDPFRKENVMAKWMDLINGLLKSGGVKLFLPCACRTRRARYADFCDCAGVQGGEVSLRLRGQHPGADS